MTNLAKILTTRRSGLKAPIVTYIDPVNAPRRARAITTRPRKSAKRLAPIVESGTRRQTANAGWPVKIKTANCAKNGDLPNQPREMFWLNR